MSCEVWTEALPRDAPIARPVDVLRAVVHRMRSVRRNLHRRHALEAILQLAPCVAVERLRADPVALLIRSAQILPAELALATAVDDLGFHRVGNDRSGFAAGAGPKVLPISQRKAGHDDGSVVLLRAVDAVGILVVHRHLVDFGGRLIGLRAPGAAAVDRHVRAAIVGLDHVLRIPGIDPNIVIVAVRSR